MVFDIKKLIKKFTGGYLTHKKVKSLSNTQPIRSLKNKIRKTRKRKIKRKTRKTIRKRRRKRKTTKKR